MYVDIMILILSLDGLVCSARPRIMHSWWWRWQFHHVCARNIGG